MCDKNELLYFFIYFFREFTIKNIEGESQTSQAFHAHTTVDLMLIKLKDKWTSFPLASATDCEPLKTALKSQAPFKLVAVGRDTACTYVCVCVCDLRGKYIQYIIYAAHKV